MLRISLAFIVAAALATPLLAQGDVLRVDYVEVRVAADGTASVEGNGTHYIHEDGRHRHDLMRRGSEVSYYQLPDDGVTVSVNHALRIAIRTQNQPSRFWSGPSREGFAGEKLETELGARAHGPISLYRVADETHELWVYRRPQMATEPFKYPPIAIESTMIDAENGERHIKRIVSAGRIPMADAIFTVPYEH